MSDLIQVPASAITLKHGVPMTTSLIVAETFEKLHKNVLRDIAAMECSPEFARLNFEPSDYLDKNGEPRRLFEITRNGFFFLAMGYRGAKAAFLREAYIARFDAMAEELARGHSPLPITETVTVTLGKDDYIRHLEHQLGRSYRVVATPPTPPVPPAPVVTRARPVTAADIAVAIQMFNADASKAAISRALGRSHSTVRRILDLATRATPPAPAAQPQLDLAMAGEARS